MVKKLLLPAVVSAVLLAYSCGGGSTSGDSAPVSLYFTDAPANLFPVVEVTVYEVNLCSDPACTDRVNLFSDPNGVTIDLTDLNGVLQYIDTVNIPQGSYARLEIVLDQKARICDNSGTCSEAVFTEMDEKPQKPNEVNCPPGFTGANGNQLCYIRYSGAINPFVDGKLVVDFDLKGFEVSWSDAHGHWHIDEVKVKPLTPSERKHHEYEMYAIVDTVDTTTDSFSARWRGSLYTVNLTADTKCEISDVYYSDPASCLSQLQSGMCVEIETLDDPSTTDTITAREIEVKDSSEKCGHKGGHEHHSSYTEMKGDVSDVDTTTNTFTLGKTNKVTVTSNTYCEYNDVYYSGLDCLTNLQVGWYVEVKVNSSGEAIKIEKED